MPADPHSLSDKSLGIRRKPRGHSQSWAKTWWYGQWQNARRQGLATAGWVDDMFLYRYRVKDKTKYEQDLKWALRKELRRRVKFRQWCKRTGRGSGPQPYPLP